MPRDAIFSKPFSCARIRKLLRIRHHVISPFHELEHGKQRASFRLSARRARAGRGSKSSIVPRQTFEHTFHCSRGSQVPAPYRISDLDDPFNIAYTHLYTRSNTDDQENQRSANAAGRPRTFSTRPLGRFTDQVSARNFRQSGRREQIAPRVRSEVFRSPGRPGASRGSAGSIATRDQSGRELGAANLLQPCPTAASARRPDGSFARRAGLEQGE